MAGKSQVYAPTLWTTASYFLSIQRFVARLPSERGALVPSFVRDHESALGSESTFPPLEVQPDRPS
jgi:hypothetical protein